MALPRLDPRVSKDRIYEYGEYKVLSAQFGQRAGRGKAQVHGGGWIGTDTRSRQRSRISFGLLVGLGLALLAACSVFAAWLEADSLRLSYAREDLKIAIAGMGQSVAEAEGARLASESQVLASGIAPGGVSYPAQTKYVVLTNIPQYSGNKLVQDLYPLSRGLLRVDP